MVEKGRLGMNASKTDSVGAPIETERAQQEHFELLELEDCKVPIGCPWGADLPEDAFPDHHGGGSGGGGGGGWEKDVQPRTKK